MISEKEALYELYAYTLTHGDPSFIHQHVVDAWVVQHADADTKPIGLTFGLVGLYLKIEKQFSGRQVQRAHMDLGKHKQVWPDFEFPVDRGSMTTADVIAAPAGAQRDKAIDEWGVSVWLPWRPQSSTIADLLERNAIIRI